MTTPSNLEIVKAFLEAAGSFQYDKAFAMVTDDCRYANMPDPSAVRVGPAQARAALEPFFKPTVENDLQLLNAIEVGDIVFTERLDRHRLPDKWVELPVCSIFEMRDGKIAAWREYFDMSTIARQWPAG